ncbi:uncharacterized protein DMAD_10412 [Drosophila madeirensis]|uniref:DUF4770 domain-containing protein n=1 Tax=Drosophila madeirensis TaxID=30013 RepID=A0AAU9F9G0_DROMD
MSLTSRRGSARSTSRDPQGLQTLRQIQQHLGPNATGKLACVEAGWYRDISNPQMDAALALKDALRDDIEQRTTRRTWQLVEILGLRPRPSRKTLVLLMRMSRGNDLAFLWFLMEMCYKTEAHGRAYDINEQIIMSAIFWLDLYPTLQELERVLPLPNASEKDRANATAGTEHRRKKSRKVRKHRSDSENWKSKKPAQMGPLSPYFQEPPVIKSWHPTRNFFSQFPARPALLSNMPKDKGTGTSPLLSRWFGDYDLSDSNRITRAILNEEIRNIIASFNAVKLPANDVETMCTHHQRISEMEKSLKVQLEVLKKQQCEELLSSPNRAQERRRKRVIYELEQMVACCQARFREMAARTRLASTRKKLYSCASGGTSVDGKVLCLGNRSGVGDGCSEQTNVRQLKGENPLIQHCCPDFKLEKMDCANCELYEPGLSLPEQCKGKSLGRPSSLMQFLKLCDIEEEKLKEEEKEKAPPQSQSCSDSKKLFEYGVPGAEGFKFNYRRLFGPSKATRLDEQNLRLKAAFAKALDEDCEFLNATLNGEEEASLDVLVDRAAKRVFASDTKIFHEEYERLLRRKSELIADRRLNLGIQHFDPEDIPLMKRMLRMGLDTVAKDRRYVLPTLPNVHTVPYLIEWICSRYGKRYSQDDRERSYAQNTFQMSILYDIMKYPLVKPPSEMHTKRLRCHSKNLREQQTTLFVEALMSVGRVFFSAMRSPLCHSPPGDTFYAYMPAAYRDTAFTINKNLHH